jgi:ABC-2 type transport system ATP-binding protein
MIVEIENLTKIYDSKLRVVALDGINLELQQGEIFGLLGPNGAGKTTTISIATTRTLPTSGRVCIAGIDVVRHPAHARRLIGVVPQFNTLDRSLTVYENLYFHCRYFGFSHARAKSRSLELLTQFMLSECKSVYLSLLAGRNGCSDEGATGTDASRLDPDDDERLWAGHDGNETPCKQSGCGTGVRPKLAAFT